jgi:hypothetical protein
VNPRRVEAIAVVGCRYDHLLRHGGLDLPLP